MNSFIRDNALQLPFSEAKIEQRARGSQKRRDLTLLGRDRKPLLTGEVKLPWQKDGQSPFVEAVVLDARQKAERVNAPWFFTWNVRQLVLWRTDAAGTAGGERHYKVYRIGPVAREADLASEYVVESLRENLHEFLRDFAKIVEGTDELKRRPPDDYFIESLESFLEQPIELAFWELSHPGADPRRKEAVRHWMVREQGWTLSGDEQEDFKRASRFATYAVVNKLVFYEALRKRFQTLAKLSLSPHIASGEKALESLITAFARAQDVTRDYETVFRIDEADIGSRIPFYPRESAGPWRNLVDHIDRFDFSRLDYDVIGRIFERLIDPTERHRFGQYYTRPEVVDLINSFCIPHGAASVLDPGCGGGTFLVRAYHRKQKLAPHLEHAQFIAGLYGIDLSRFAAHLTTINLAGRDLIQAENYPRVIRADFFDVNAGETFMTLPAHDAGAGVALTLENVDAVVGNPPYVRQEDIPNGNGKQRGQPRKGTKAYYLRKIEQETGVRLSGRSDLHCYFWGHAWTFLRPAGWLGFLTSSQWLDVEYGFRLQGWLLDHFRIAAVFESQVEPWFVGARVATAATIAQREEDAALRDANTVRFVQLRKPLHAILADDGTSRGMIEAADRLRDLVLGAERDTATAEYRIRLVRQGDLREEGVSLGRLMEGIAAAGEGEDDDEPIPGAAAPGEYFGGKWGIQLRAPDIWFDLQRRTSGRWARLSQLAEVRFGVKTGADDFFYVRDVSAEGLARFSDSKEFIRHYGCVRADVEKDILKLVRNGRGEVAPIEARFLEPEVHSLMEIGRFSVSAKDCSRLVLLAPSPRRAIRGTYALRYIERGEGEGFHKGATCASRVSKGDPEKGIPPREWYDLTGRRRGSLFYMKSSQYKHVVPRNSENLTCNCNLYDVFPKESVEGGLLAGILNSSVSVIAKQLFGRPVGVEGNLKTEVIDVKMMLVPNPMDAPTSARARVATAFEKLRNRQALAFLSERRLRRMAYTERGRAEQLEQLSDLTELDQPDRHELDDAVLELLGITEPDERLALRTRIYDFLRSHYEAVRQKEEVGIANKKRAKRASRLTPAEIAAQVYDQVMREHPELGRTYQDFLTASLQSRSDGLRIPPAGRPEIVDDMITTGVRFATGKGRGRLVPAHNVEQAKLIKLVAEAEGFGRNLFFPFEAKTAARLRDQFERHIEKRQKVVRAFVEERTADVDLQEKIIEKVIERLSTIQRVSGPL